MHCTLCADIVLHIMYCTMNTVQCTMNNIYTVQCTMNNIYFTLFHFNCSLYSVYQYSKYSVKCVYCDLHVYCKETSIQRWSLYTVLTHLHLCCYATDYNVHYTLYVVHWTLYNVLSTVYSVCTLYNDHHCILVTLLYTC